MIIPVKDATRNDWNSNSFWAYPWGKSVVHKGIDIFGKKGTPILSPQRGIIIFRGNLGDGGNAVLLTGPMLRIHYFAHLDSICKDLPLFVRKGETVGYLGNTGNAINTPPHLHYAILTIVPYFWNYSKDEPQAWKRIFYLDPGEVLKR